ncbi:hypothetical protein [Mesorhizobium sp. WSM3224]|uniref:hypothetical protein n=1 Tax=Mesorhizobium sp. WSM3224 TaxID=1040986 RepID=UPI001FD9F011|nr:hypothetical protein [Mesorhizobium sp. WSM3224]
MLAGGIALQLTAAEQQVELARVNARQARQVPVVRAVCNHDAIPPLVERKLYDKCVLDQSVVSFCGG